MAAVMFRGRSFKSQRLRGRYENAEENVSLDYSQGVDKNVKEILHCITQKDGISKARKLGYYNAFARLCYRFGGPVKHVYSIGQYMSCLRLGLLHEDKEMRAACLRALRYFIQDKNDVETLIYLHVDYLIAKCLDICYQNEIERIHALRLMRKMIHVAPDIFPTSLVNVLVSIAKDGLAENDRMHRTCLATLCELCFFNPEVVASSGGLTALLKNVILCPQLPRINESLLTPIYYILNHPRTRHYIRPDIDLEQIVAPFTDYYYCFSSAEKKNQPYGHDREVNFAAVTMGVASIMKSWPGMMRLCKPDCSGLQSLLGTLYLDHTETRRDIMDLFFEVFRLPVPVWTDDFSVALASVDPSEMQENWRLIEGFVAAEGKAILKHLAKTRPNLVENHLALLLSSFISAGLLEILVEVITSSPVNMAVRATILLGDLLHMANTLLPYECSNHTHCLPTLIDMASSFSISADQRYRASLAITWLDHFHALKKRGPIPCSMFLQQIVQLSEMHERESNKVIKPNKDKLLQYFDREDCDLLNQAMKDSQVLLTKENNSWNWELITAVLQWPDDSMRKLEEQVVNRFIRRVLYFYKPTNKLFSKVELSSKQSNAMADAGCRLMDFLLKSDSDDSGKYLEELLRDIDRCLGKVKEQIVTSDHLFSPHRLQSYCSQYYFLFFGRISASSKGEKLLQKTGIFQSLMDILNVTSHDTYVKLIVSSLDYSRDGNARVILNKGLAATQESGKLYTTSLMRVLLRAGVPFFSTWGMEMLVLQLYDPCKQVAMEALGVITEACEDEVNLHTLVTMRPSVLHLGYKGCLLLARFMSIPAGFKFLSEANYVESELKRWHETFNLKYVKIIEERLNEALTTYESTYDGSYIRRSNRKETRKDVFLPVHLYSQLVQHLNGYQLLAKQDYIHEYFDTIRFQMLDTDEDIIKLKAALWVAGHFGRSVWGVKTLEEEMIVPQIIKLAEESAIFSVRGTAVYVLGLIASTHKGALLLGHFGWESARHSRASVWPVVDMYDPATDTPAADTDEGRGLAQSISMLSLASAARSESSRKSAQSPVNASKQQPPLLLKTPDQFEAADDLSSPVFNLSPSPNSPAATFYISKSRSDTIDSETMFSLDRNRSETGGSSKSDASDVNSSEKNTIETNAVISGTEKSTPIDIGNHKHFHSLNDNPYVDSKAEVNNSVDNDKESNNLSIPSVLSKGRSKSDSNSQSTVHFETDDLEASKKAVEYQEIRKQRTNTGANESDSGMSSQDGSARGVRDKSRSSSSNTDTALESFESSPEIQSDHAKLSSSAPNRSLLRKNHSRTSLKNEDRDDNKIRLSSHPSDNLRRLVNLKRLPSAKRRYTNPVLGPLSKSLGHKELTEDFTMTYTSKRDAYGYAALRDLQRQHYTNEMDEGNKTSLFTNLAVAKASSVADFRNTRIRKSFSMRLPKLRKARENISCLCSRNMSYTSLKDALGRDGHSPSSPVVGFADSGFSTLPRVPSQPGMFSGSPTSQAAAGGASRKPQRTSVGKAEYIGIALPVDISMIFQVNEGEDSRCSDDRGHAEKTGHDRGLTVTASKLQSGDDGLEVHSPGMCLGCHKAIDVPPPPPPTDTSPGEAADDHESSGIRSDPRNNHAAAADDDIFHPCSSVPPSGPASPFAPSFLPRSPRLHKLDPAADRRRGSEAEFAVDVLESRLCGAEAGGGGELTEDSPEGRALVRKEVLKLVINMSSSVGVKAAEKGLIILRQKFPGAFNDICLYSEVSYLLANYGYRMQIRRYVQELFQDAEFPQLYDFAREVCQLSEESKPCTPPETDLRLENVPESVA